MKVLLGHCYYRSSAPSGEDAVYENEKALLVANGIDVIPFERFNDDIDISSAPKRIRQALATSWSFDASHSIRRTIAQHKPDIAHFHNTFPQLSPSVYATCKNMGVPVVQTLHNYRIICAGALLQRDNHPCEDCVGRLPAPALSHRCYRDSLSATSALVLMQMLNRVLGSYSRMVDRYIALTEFAASRMVAGGIPADKLVVKPNFLPISPSLSTERDGYAVYVGRLSQEKGVRTLIQAWQQLREIPLKVLGDGPLLHELSAQSAALGLNVQFLGSVSRDRVLEITGRAALQVVPSEWYEGFPMVILEAYASGTPVVASAIGSLDEIVLADHTGWKFRPGDSGDLARTVKYALSDRERLADAGHNAHAYYCAHFTPALNFTRLEQIYSDILQTVA